MLRSARRSANDGTPYARYAFFNPYNVSLLGGAVVLSAATGEWWVGLIAGGLEAAWMLLAPDSKLLQRAWFDPAWEREQREALRARVATRAAALPDAVRPRAHALLASVEHVRALAEQNESLAVDLMKSELSRLDELALEFVDILERCVRAEQHLATFDVARMQAAHRFYGAQAESLDAGDPRAAVARKNLAVLEERRERYTELQRTAGALRGQLDLVESTLRLLADEVVSAATPAAIAARIDDLHAGVATARQVSRELASAEHEVDDERADNYVHHACLRDDQNRT